MRILIVSADRSTANGSPVNVGDALLTDRLAEALHSVGHSVSVADFGEGASARPNRTKAKGVRGLLSLILRNDAVVLGGGTLIQEDSRNLLAGSLLRLCLATSLLARVTRSPLAYFAVGCDPLPSRLARWGYRVATHGAPVWVRDGESAKRFNYYFGRQPFLGADAALLSGQSYLARRTSADTSQVTVALNFADAARLSAADVAHIRAAGPSSPRVVFLAMSRGPRFGDDLALGPGSLSAFDAVESTGDWRVNWESIAASSMVVASRMHALYIAALTQRPMIAVGKSSKVRSFAREFGVPHIGVVSEIRAGMARLADAQAVDDAIQRSCTSLRDLDSWLSRRASAPCK